LFVSVNEVLVVLLALPTGEQLIEDSHVQHSLAHPFTLTKRAKHADIDLDQ
jgi:hypothetical protein